MLRALSPLRREGTFSFFLLLVCAASVRAHQEFADQEWTDQFAVEIAEKDNTEAELIVSSKGFTLLRSEPTLKVHHVKHPGACTNKHRCKRHAADLVDLLKKTPYVTRVEQQYLLKRDKRLPVDFDEGDSRDAIVEETELSEKDQIYRRAVIERHETLKFDYDDPLYRRQWHLDNFGQIANPGLDLNLLPAWRKGYQGQGSRVTVVDDGVDTKHKDLQHAYDPRLSADLNDPTDLRANPHDPGSRQKDENGHGTSCAGEIAAMPNNSVCGSGVAPRIKLGGVRILAGAVTDLLEAFSVLHMHNETEIYSCSWGPKDNGKVMEMPHYYTGMALGISTTRGRNGLGNIFTYASGNGGLRGDNCGADGYVNMPFTFPMAAVNIYGRSVFYGERCSAIIAAAPVGGRSAKDASGPADEKKARISTTAINQECTTNFAGTSAAAPLGAGCLSLVLQANRNLTLRDVQHVIAHSARIPNPAEKVWQKNGAGFHVSHHFGFGLLDCSKAIKVAQTWKNVGAREKCTYNIFKGKDRIYSKRSRRYTFSLRNCTSGNRTVGSIEHVTVALKVDHKLRGDLEIWLISPAGTVSRLLGRRWPDRSSQGIDFVFLTRYLLGESPHGSWTLQVSDLGLRRTKGRVRGAIRSAVMTVYGTEGKSPAMKGKKLGKAKRLTKKEVATEYEKERVEALKVFPEHRDVLELKRELERGQKKGMMKKVVALMKNEEVSKKEMKSVVDLVRKINKKKGVVKKDSEEKRKAEEKARKKKELEEWRKEQELMRKAEEEARKKEREEEEEEDVEW